MVLISSCLYDELLQSDKNRLKQTLTNFFLKEINGFEDY
jgi:hypothetical protein